MTMSKVLVVALACTSLVSGFNVSPSPRAVTKTAAPRAIAIPLDSPTAAGTSNDDDARQKASVDPEHQWVAALDYEGFTKEVNALGKQLLQETGEADVEHLNKMVRWRDLCALVGVATMWCTPNPITILALSTWTYASWTMIAHHTCHGGYNRVDAGKYNSRGFALGSVVKRIQDWCDWMAVDAWNIEHNRLHHYHLGEKKDPDLVERNMEFLREVNLPAPAKYAMVGVLAAIWKWFYYAPNTYKELQLAQWRREGKELPKDMDPKATVVIKDLLFPKEPSAVAAAQVVQPSDFFVNVLGPFFLSRFVLLPAPLLAIPGVGPTLFGHAVLNLLLAEVLTNMHGFLTIVTNHAGEDVYSFDDQVKPKTGSFYVRQIVGSANYKTGSDLNDFAHGFLNYQIEHHVWPDLSMLQYQRGAPKLKAICEKYGVPYVQESVWTRLRKTTDIMVGKADMKVFPTELEPVKDKAVNGVKWKSTNGAIDDDQ